MQHMTFNPATAMEGSRPSAIACCRFVCLNPVTLAVSFLVAVIIGTWAGPVAAVLAVVAAGAVLLAASPLPMTRRLVAPVLARKARRDRHERQRERLERAGSIRRTELDELSRLVEEIEEHDPAECERFELDELVDLYVDMAVLVESYRSAARHASGLIGDGDERHERPAAGGGQRLRRDLVRRRIAHRDECTSKVAELDGELDAVIELVRLVAQRAVCPAGADPLEPQLVRRVWELDTRDSALRQLSGDEPTQ